MASHDPDMASSVAGLFLADAGMLQQRQKPVARAPGFQLPLRRSRRASPLGTTGRRPGRAANTAAGGARSGAEDAEPRHLVRVHPQQVAQGTAAPSTPVRLDETPGSSQRNQRNAKSRYRNSGFCAHCRRAGLPERRCGSRAAQARDGDYAARWMARRTQPESGSVFVASHWDRLDLGRSAFVLNLTL